MAEPLRAFRADPYSYDEAHALTEALGVSEPVAITLVRRGYRTPDEARRFLSADEEYSPDEFAGMAEVADTVLAAAEAGARVTVHGDFDVDGVCSTAILVGTLRRLGAECDWLIPDRMADGYGLSTANVERLAERGTELLITVDCGITSVAEVAAARELGMEVIVTDHHQPGDELPDCLILHPVVSNYPCPDLCGTGVAWKLACALSAMAGQADAALADLDLVALATVADIVSLTGENRTLVRRGIDRIRRAPRPGLRALIEAASCEPSRIDEGDLSFRLAPRINAAGRLYRADAGVELFLTEDPERATAIAAELDRANHERRATEQEVEWAAEAAIKELPDDLREAPALVVAGPDWHPGVVGIVASKLAERHFKPTVVISLNEDGSGRGSGRSIPGFDLLAAMRAGEEHLARFGGHRAAAGLELKPGALDAFRRAFADHAGEVFATDPPQRTERVDVVIGGAGLGLGLAEELEQLKPFGAGNPGIRLLVPSARVRNVATMGEGRHSRFSLHSGSHQAKAVAFGRSSIGATEEDTVDAAVRLEVNHFNGSIEPRVVLRDLYPLGARDEAGDKLRHVCEHADADWWARLDGVLEEEPASAAPARTAGSVRRTVPHTGSPTSVLAELVSTGEGVLAVCADASRRAELALGAAGLTRFGAPAARVACGRCSMNAIAAALEPSGECDVVLTDYAALALVPGGASGFCHVVQIDPPGSPEQARLVEPAWSERGGYLHPAWGRAERDFALLVAGDQFDLRPHMAGIYRALRAGGPLEGGTLRAALEGDGDHPRSPELAGRCLRVLAEAGLLDRPLESGVRAIGAVSSEKTELERSATYRACRTRHEEARSYLESHAQP